MSTFFKYTTGLAYTLSGENYTGFFNITNGIPYTDKKYTSLSKQLSSKDTFYSKCYNNLINFDRTSAYTIPISFDTLFANSIIDSNNLNRILNTLHNNNLNIFAAVAGNYTDYFNLLSQQTNQTHFYSISSQEDSTSGKNVYTHSDLFSGIFENLDNVISGAVLVDNDDVFTYMCGTPTGTIAVSGSFSNTNTLQPSNILDRFNLSPDTPHNFIVDSNDNALYIVSPTSFSIYDVSSWQECGSTILVDRVTTHQIGKQFVSPYNFAVGNNYRISSYTSSGNPEIVVHNKYTGEVSNIITYQTLSANSILAIDIRQEDDLICAITSSSGEYYINFVTPSLEITRVSIAPITDKFHYQSIGSDYRVKFAPFDSNLVFLYNKSGIELRCISNPKYKVAEMYREGALFLDDYKFNNTEERFNKIKIKFGSNAYTSNYINILNLSIGLSKDSYRMIIHNRGRIYASKISNTSELSQLDIKSQYSSSNIASNSGFNIVFNTLLQSIISDTIRLYYSIGAISKIQQFDTSTLTQANIGISDIGNINIDDMFIHENEDINTSTLYRIFLQIYNIQFAIASSLSTN